MVTQVIMADVNNRELDTIYARSGDDEIREIEFIICRNNPPEKVEIPAGVSGQFRIVKSSGNFVVRDMSKTVREDGTVIFTVAVSDQMVNVQGTGYYDIRLSGGGYLYTASGEFIVDTPVLSTSVLTDVSEVNGLIFPDDFLTTEDYVARINDNVIASTSVWSSYKTNEAIEEAIESIDIPPAREYSTVEKVIGKWLNGTDLYAKTYTIDVNNPPSTYNTQIDVTGLNIVNIEKHYAEYLYNNVWYYLVGDSLTYNNSEYLHLQYYGEQKNIIELLSHLGSVTEIRLCFTLIYTKGVNA